MQLNLDAMPMFPLSTVLFPSARIPLHVFEHRYRVMLRQCLETDGCFGIVLISRGSEVGGGESRTSFGTVSVIENASWLPDGRAIVVARAMDRVRVLEWLEDEPFPRARVELLEEPSAAEEDLLAAFSSAWASLRRAQALLSEMEEGRVNLPDHPPAPLSLSDASWWLCDMAPLGPHDRQRLLESPDALERLGLLERLTEELADDLERLLAGG